MQSRVKTVVHTAVYTIIALGLSYIEVLIPLHLISVVPGFKLGISNIITVYLITRNKVQALSVLVLKTMISTILFAQPTALLFSLCGGVLSFAVMSALSAVAGNKLSYIGISAAGGVFHNIGQLIITAIMFGLNTALYYSTPMLFAGIISGSVIGALLNIFSERISRIIES